MSCTWTQDYEGIWHTGCGNAFQIAADTPRDNEFLFCCYCGKPLEQVEYQEEGEA